MQCNVGKSLIKYDFFILKNKMIFFFILFFEIIKSVAVFRHLLFLFCYYLFYHLNKICCNRILLKCVNIECFEI